MKSPKRLSRRQFIKTAGIAGGIMAVPALFGGYNLWEATAGDRSGHDPVLGPNA